MTSEVQVDPLAYGEHGVIINTAFLAAQDGQTGQAVYSASKAGVVGLALPVARDLMNDGCRGNTILPVIFERQLLLVQPDNVRQWFAVSVPIPKRLGLPNEFAAVLEMMVRSTYVNGESVRVDGAIRMQPR
jgi:NAD(P)-dependent dehydrogenase (short-subunit alcohol dehydrogenase family)